MNDGTSNPDMNHQFFTQGYTCAVCAQFVPVGVNHTCTFTAYIPPPDPQLLQLVQMTAILERIAKSLEQIESRLPTD